MDFLDRERKIFDDSKIDKLKNSNVIVFGVGGVGSFAAEALVRAGVGNLTIVDKDVVDPTNINRQLIALNSTIGKPKVEVAKERFLDINPDLNITAIQEVYKPETSESFNLENYDFIVDAIDMVTGKIELIEQAKEKGVPVIASMGMGNRLHPEYIQVADISKTHMDPLAKVMRSELKKRNIKKVPVVFSSEAPVIKTRPPGSISFVPSSAGLMLASYVVNNLIENE